MLAPSLIALRDLTLQDVPLVLNYWFRSKPGFIESLGVDPNKMPTELQMATNLVGVLEKNSLLPESKLHALVITYDNEPVGFHTVNPITEGETAIFHAHIFKSELRGKGLAYYSYPLACNLFIKRFNLKKILFKTPIQNIGALRVKEKLGIRYVGEEIIDFSIIKAGTLAKVFELDCAESENLLVHLGLRPENEVSLIDFNLTLTREERILQHDQALATFLELEKNSLNA